jgi:cellulose synthase/poly-beta-1,6-N-acetylglucosamine synthase-like glycosyltransferase
MDDTSTRLWRFLEMVPGLLAWILLIGLLVGSFLIPQAIALLLMGYAVYWIVRTMGYFVRMSIVYVYVQRDVRVDWYRRCQLLSFAAVERTRCYLDALHRLTHGTAVTPWRMLYWFFKDKERLYGYWTVRDVLKRERHDDVHPWEHIKHVVIIPMYKEGMQVLRPTLEHLSRAHYDKDKLHIIFATEAADAQGEPFAQELCQLFGAQLPHLYITKHTLQVGEAAGKSSNQAFVGAWIKKNLIDAQGWDAHDVLVTSLDADYRILPEYFGYLTYHYATDPVRTNSFYQLIPMFFNNLWNVPFFSRIQSALCTQIQMGFQLEQRRINFSCYALSFDLLQRSGFWDPGVIQEDSRLFWRAFFATDGAVKVRPLFFPVFGDATRGRTYISSIGALYTQIRRWAWGASDIPYVVINAMRAKKINLSERMLWVGKALADFFHWGTMPIVLAVGSLLPVMLNKAFAETVMGYNLPLYISRLLTITTMLTIILIAIDRLLSPPLPATWNTRQKIFSYAQWFLMPLVGIVFSAIPALDAQTRLMFGKKLTYQVTEKGL